MQSASTWRRPRRTPRHCRPSAECSQQQQQQRQHRRGSSSWRRWAGRGVCLLSREVCALTQRERDNTWLFVSVVPPPAHPTQQLCVYPQMAAAQQPRVCQEGVALERVSACLSMCACGEGGLWPAVA
jgi:hypothetical protein